MELIYYYIIGLIICIKGNMDNIRNKYKNNKYYKMIIYKNSC